MGPKRTTKLQKTSKTNISAGEASSSSTLSSIPEPVVSSTADGSLTRQQLMAVQAQGGSAFETQTEDYSKPKIFVATPCYAGQIHVRFMESVLSLSHTLAKEGINMDFYSIPFESLIPRARNASITRFMNNSDSTHILFVDGDIQFHPTSVLKMLKEDKDVIAGCYPKKTVDWDRLKLNIDQTANSVELIQSAMKYAYNLKPQQSHKMERGCVEVLDAPTGFLLIKKSAIREMIKHYPETEYVNDVAPYHPTTGENRFFDLFQSRVIDGRYLSEDYGFCRLWQKMNKPIYADLTVKLNHFGSFAYFGDPLQELKTSKNVQMLSKPV